MPYPFSMSSSRIVLLIALLTNANRSLSTQIDFWWGLRCGCCPPSAWPPDCRCSGCGFEGYADAFVLNPVGHFGLVPAIFLVTFPLVQVIVFFLLATIGFAACWTSWLGAATATGVVSSTLTGLTASGSGVTGCAFALCFNFNFMTGAEKWNPAAETRKVSPTTLEAVDHLFWFYKLLPLS